MIQMGRLVLVVAVLLPAFLVTVGERASEARSSLAALAAPTLVSPIGGTLTSFGANLQWTEATGATQAHIQVIPYRNAGPGADVYLGSSASSFWVPAPPEWYGLLPDMIYTWRVRVSDATRFVSLDDASWSPWAESYFRTPTATSFLISATSPAQNAVINTLTPTLSWANGQYGVFYYELQLSKNEAFNTDPATATAIVYWMVIHGGVTQPANSYTVPEGFYLERGARYYWRVRPRVQGNGTPVAWSQTFAFNTATDASVLYPTPTPTATATATPTPVATPAGIPYRIAFTSKRDGNEEIYVMNADGSGQTRLTNHEAIDTNPVFSPDGTRIAFLSTRDGNQEVYLMNANGSGLWNLSQHSARDEQPAWSPYSNRVALVSQREGTKHIYSIFVDGSYRTRLDGGGSLGTRPLDQPTWLPDNARLTFVVDRGGGNKDICMAFADGVDLKCLTSDPAIDERPVMSPDRLKFAFVSERDTNREIYVMDADGLNQKRLTSNLAQDDNPSWSPDGTNILFESNRDGNWEIYVMKADGSGQRSLTNNPAVDLRPQWSPDGKSIVFESSRDGAVEIYVMNADGSGLTNLTTNPAFDGGPAWSPK